MSETDEDLYAAIEDALAFTDTVLPTHIQQSQERVVEPFVCAAIRRLADLLRAERDLARSGNIATSRVVGRAAIEAWLWASYLLLDPSPALDRLLTESNGHQRRQLIGMNRLWERVEKLAKSDLPPPDPVPTRDGAADPNVKVLAELVSDARTRRGYDGGKADLEYQQTYRWDSVHDVHPSFEMFMRYFDMDEREARVHRSALLGEGDELRGVGGAFDTAKLLLEVVAMYAKERGVRVKDPWHSRVTAIWAMKGH